ncbi:MAG: triacylglycerol lipase [Myxococcales bacterium]|nr:triacylglycerol lipase [Myxococcales bacterium]
MPRGAHWRIEVDDAPADARLFAYGPRFGRPGETPPAAGRTEVAGEAAHLELELIAAVAGEQFVVVEREDARVDDVVRARAVCVEGCELEATRFPVVLVHGYAGVDSYFGVLDYFYDIRDPLRAAGYDVYTPVMDAIATSSDRAAQLAPQIDAVLDETGARAVNIIAHSQGGLDARYLVSTMGYGDRVASITTVATPHHGIGAALFDFLSAQSFDPDDIEVFNAENPDDARVRYWSWSARTCGLLAFDCQRSSSGETVDAFLIATHTLLGRFGDNDGIVPTASMTWGEPLGMLFADHFDEVGQIADGSPDGDPFDHRAFYRSEVRRLRDAGL